MKKLFLFLFFLSQIAIAQTPDATIKTNNDVWIRSAPTILGENEATLFDQITNSKTSRIENNLATGTNTYLATIGWVTSYTKGLWFPIQFQNSNTGGSTININSLGAKNIKIGSLALISGDISSVKTYFLWYDGTNFQLAGGGGSGGGTWGSITGTLSSQTDLQTALNAKIGLSDISATSPLSYNSVTGAFSFPSWPSNASGALTNNGSGTLSWSPITSTIAGATDANISSPTNNQFFRYKTSDSKWHNDSFVAGTDYAPATSGSSILYGNGSGGFSNVTIGSNLTFSGGTLSSSGGFTNPMTTLGDIIYENSTPAAARLAANSTSTNKYLQSVSSGAPSWAQVAFSDLSGSASLTTQVSGTLPIANGGTNNGSLSVTNGNIVYTDGSKLTGLAIGTQNQVLTVNSSGVPTWQSSYWKTVPGSPTRSSNTVFTITDASNANLYDKLLGRTTVLKWTDGGSTKMAMVVSATYATNTVTITIIGDVLSGTATMSTFNYCLQRARVVSFAIAGTIATGTNLSRKWKADCSIKVFGADALHGTAGTTNATTYQINKNGSTIFTTNISIASGATVGDGFTADDGTTLALDDVLTLDCNSVSTTAPVDVYIDLFIFNLNDIYR